MNSASRRDIPTFLIPQNRSNAKPNPNRLWYLCTSRICPSNSTPSHFFETPAVPRNKSIVEIGGIFMYIEDFSSSGILSTSSCAPEPEDDMPTVDDALPVDLLETTTWGSSSIANL